MNELKCVINRSKFDIIEICQTKLDTNYEMKIRGYSIYKVDRNMYVGGVALMYKNSIKYNISNIPTLEKTEDVAIDIETGHNSIVIVQIYIPPNSQICKIDLNKLFRLSKKVIIMEISMLEALHGNAILIMQEENF